MNIQRTVALVLFLTSAGACQEKAQLPPVENAESSTAAIRADGQSSKSSASVPGTERIVSPRLSAILADARVQGTVVLYTPSQDRFVSNDFKRASQALLPASTFKIANTIIALETGVVADQRSVLAWDGKPQPIKAWEKDLSLTDAFRASCVPCYRDIARRIGLGPMTAWLKKLGYAKAVVLTEADLDLFWLRGPLKISPLEQVDFMVRLQAGRLPIKKRVETIIKDIMVTDKTATYTLRGKTGLSVNDANDRNGWFVGWVEGANGPTAFATNIERLAPGATVPSNKDFSRLRKKLTVSALIAEGIIDSAPPAR